MKFYFQKRDQAAIAIVLSIAILVIFWKYASFRRDGEVIDIETEPKREYQFTIDINSAEWPEIALVPGIGQELATRIENYRTEIGGYSSLDQLRNVDGIGPNKLKALKKFLRPFPERERNEKELESRIPKSKNGV
jgi:competence protein ComEA